MPKAIRPIRIEGNLAYITLTQGYEAVIDVADVPLVQGYNWYAKVHPRSVYARTTYGRGSDSRAVSLHRLIMGEPEGAEIDHRDGDGLNNRRGNLRIATGNQNRHNQRRRIDNTSGLKGVSWCSHRKRWKAQIMLDGKKKHIGHFDTPDLAYAAYCKASVEFHGEFGRVE